MFKTLNDWFGRVPDFVDQDFSMQRTLIEVIADSYLDENDIFTRAYCQFLCQKTYKSAAKNIFLDVFCFFLVLPLLLYFWMKELFSKKISYPKKVRLFSDEGLLPNEPESREVSYIKANSGLDFKDFKFILKLIYKYPSSFYFICKSIYKISLYSALIRGGASKIYVTSEYSFTSSILTAYCRLGGAEHINVMHGEKLYFIGDSFFEFDRYYVWDKHYIDLFKELRASLSQFIVCFPRKFDSLLLEKNNFISLDSKILTYYLDYDKPEIIEKIENIISKLFPFHEIYLRPHPRYCSRKRLNSIIKKVKIEDENVSIFKSIARSDVIISRASTVLFEAFQLEKKIVIDDVSTNLYGKLKEAKYIMLSKPHSRLSEFLNK